MKALFYTATAVFITLAGVIAYFALQPPTSGSGARIVLEIDAGAMPAVETGSNASPALDPYPGAEDDKPADAEPAQRAEAPVEGQQDPESASPQDHAAAPSAAPSQDPLLQQPPAQPGAPGSERAGIPSPPPGTALARQNGPLFRELAPGPQAEAQVAQNELPPTSPESAPVGSAPEQGLPGSHLALPVEPEASRPAAGFVPGVVPAQPANPAEV